MSGQRQPVRPVTERWHAQGSVQREQVLPGKAGGDRAAGAGEEKGKKWRLP